MEKKFKKKYPELFSEDFIYECGDGWLEIIEKVCEKITWAMNAPLAELTEPYPKTKIIRIKEKFGALEIYLSEYHPYYDKIIRSARFKSMTICEICGKKGRLKGKNGWWMTRCKECGNE